MTQPRRRAVVPIAVLGHVMRQAGTTMRATRIMGEKLHGSKGR